MKKLAFFSIMILVLSVQLLAPQVTRAQGTTFLSNLAQPSSGSLAVGSDSWHAEFFTTGTNAGGYALNSIQLVLATGSGNPSGFTISLHTNFNPGFLKPGGSIALLAGSSNPVSGGIYTYTPSTSVTLGPWGGYFIVVTAGTPVADGAYAWSHANSSSYGSPDGWLGGPVFHSSDGSSWVKDLGSYPQFAVNATGVPEPSCLALLCCGGFLLAARRFRVQTS